MKATTIFLCFALFGVLGNVNAQRFPTNNISQEQVIKIASRLWTGMSQEQVEKAVDKKHGLQAGANVGSSIGYVRFYVLSNDCNLNLRFTSKELDTNLWLSAAFITKRTGEKDVSITLTKAPYHQALPRVRPSRSGCNRPTSWPPSLRKSP